MPDPYWEKVGKDIKAKQSLKGSLCTWFGGVAEGTYKGLGGVCPDCVSRSRRRGRGTKGTT